MGTRTRVKICCIMTPAEAEMAAAAGADLLGLVGQMPTGPGPIEEKMARHIAACAVPWAPQVLLTACESADDITEHAARIGVRTVQVVNHIAPAIHARLARAAAGLARIQVIHVEDDGAAIRLVRPFGVDVCSGVRVAGRLDRERLTAFIEAVHRADREAGA